MAIIIDGKVYRNLQEQVQKNKDDIETKQDKLVAGENITINGNTISAKGGSGTPSDYDTVKAQVETNRVAINTEEESRKASYTKVETEISSLSSSIDDRFGTIEESISEKQNKLEAGDNITIKNNVISSTGTPTDYATVKAQVETNTTDINDLSDKVSPIEDMCSRDNLTKSPDEINQYITQLKDSSPSYYRMSVVGKDITITVGVSTETYSYNKVMKVEFWYDKGSSCYQGYFIKRPTDTQIGDMVVVSLLNISSIKIDTIGTTAVYYLGYNADEWFA